MLARFGYDVVAVDPDLGALANNRRRPSFDGARIAGTVRVAAGLAERLPVADGACAGVLCMNAMHHVSDLPAAVAELARVLAPGGRVVLCEPGLAHLEAAETRRARAEHGEDDRAFDVLAFLQLALDGGFSDAMLSATLQPPLRLLPLQEIDLFTSGRHPRPHMTPPGVVEELHRHHAYAMLVRDGAKAKTSRHPGVLACTLDTDPLPATVRAGGRLAIHVRAANTGDTQWLARPSPYGGYVTFGCKWTDAASGRLVTDVPGRTRLAADVPPGGRVETVMAVELPASLPPGEYLVKVDLVDEFVCWFSDVAPNQPREHRLTVTP